MKKFLSLVGVGIFAVVLTGCGNTKKEPAVEDLEQNMEEEIVVITTISLEQFNALENGISYAQLKEKLGGECALNTKQELDGVETAIYSCEGIEIGSQALFTFINDSLTTKIQHGLE